MAINAKENAMTGYNPYRKANGEFASKAEIGSIDEKIEYDHSVALASDDLSTVEAIEAYAIEKAPESKLGQRVLEQSYGLVSTMATATPAQRLSQLATEGSTPSLVKLGLSVEESEKLLNELELKRANAAEEYQAFVGRLSPNTQDAMEYLEELEEDAPDYATLQREIEEAFKLPNDDRRKLGTLEKRAYDHERTVVRKNREMLLALAKLLQWDGKRPGPNTDTEYRRVKKLIADERAFRRARIDTKKSIEWLKDAVKASEEKPKG